MKMSALAPALLAGLIAFPVAANAITAGDVVEKMSNDQAAQYLSGAVDMVLYLDSMNGEGQKAECILNWYYRDKSSPAEVIAVFGNYKDKPAIGLLHILIDRHCK